jgi:dTDP-4-dehydrorhamnose reductase
VLLDLAASGIRGVVHTAGAGQCSWHELCVEVFRQAGVDCVVNETTSAQFVRPAPRPVWSVLATERAAEGAPTLPDWREGVAGHLSERSGS